MDSKIRPRGEQGDSIMIKSMYKKSWKMPTEEPYIRHEMRIPQSMYFMIKAECARRRVPIASAMQEALLCYVERTDMMREVIGLLNAEFPGVIATRWYLTRKGTDEVREMMLDFKRYREWRAKQPERLAENVIAARNARKVKVNV